MPHEKGLDMQLITDPNILAVYLLNLRDDLFTSAKRPLFTASGFHMQHPSYPVLSDHILIEL